MIDNLLAIINSKYPLQALEAGEFSKMKVGGMDFTISAYQAQGLGHVSTMSAKGFFGLMKMDTIIIVPKKNGFIDYKKLEFELLTALKQTKNFDGIDVNISFNEKGTKN